MSAKKQVYSWHDVSDDEIQEIYKKLYTLVEKIVPVDCDSDYVLDIHTTDRRKFEHNPFIPIPYRDTDPEKHFEAILANMQIISDRLSIELRLRKMESEQSQAIVPN